MLADEPNLLTTGQAAKLCSVTPDTILKWLKKGKISGVRTAGGHYRIARQALEPFISLYSQKGCPSGKLTETDPRSLHCWEYLSDRGSVREECRQCVVYRVRAARCFLVAGMESEIGHALQFCQGSCDDCAYYRWAKGMATNVLVITSDDELIGSLVDHEDQGFALRFARSGYEASALVQGFHAAVVVIDQEVLEAGEGGLVESLANDPRLPGVKIILAARRGAAAALGGGINRDVVWRVIEKPLGPRRIAAEIADMDLLSRRGQHA